MAGLDPEQRALIPGRPVPANRKPLPIVTAQGPAAYEPEAVTTGPVARSLTRWRE